jgi:hypothetical protein
MRFEVQSESDLSKVEGRAANKLNGEPTPFCWIGGKELAAMNTQQSKKTVEKILGAGALTVICAKSKSGKTTLIA